MDRLDRLHYTSGLSDDVKKESFSQDLKDYESTYFNRSLFSLPFIMCPLKGVHFLSYSGPINKFHIREVVKIYIETKNLCWRFRTIRIPTLGTESYFLNRTLLYKKKTFDSDLDGRNQI